MARLLVVDDDQMVCAAVNKWLERAGHNVRLAKNGNEALRIASEVDFDLAIVDIIMPEREGIETMLELKKQKPFLKIVAMSGGGRTRRMDYLHAAERLAADGTLAKPFTGAQLQTTISKLL